MRPTRNSLHDALSPDAQALLTAAEAAASAVGCPLWAVGGAVRDLAARRPVHDVDLAFAGDARQFVDAVAARAPQCEVERTDRFGTATIVSGISGVSGGARLDLARLRTERYVVPGALPEVRATDRIERDL